MREREIDKGNDRQTSAPGYRTPVDDGRPSPSAADQGRPPLQADFRQTVKEDAAAVRNAAEEGLSSVSHQAGEAAERQKGYAADKVAGIAMAIKKAGTELEGQDEAEMGRMARQMGDSVGRFAEDIKGKDLSEIAAMAEDFGRRQPLAFLGIAAIAGLAASRFVGASASRQPTSTPRPSTIPMNRTPSASSPVNPAASHNGGSHG